MEKENTLKYYIWVRTLQKEIQKHVATSCIVMAYLDIELHEPHFRKLLHKWFPSYNHQEVRRAEKLIILLEVSAHDFNSSSFFLALWERFCLLYSPPQRFSLVLQSLRTKHIASPFLLVLVLASISTCYSIEQEAYFNNIRNNLLLDSQMNFCCSGRCTFSKVADFLKCREKDYYFRKLLNLLPEIQELSPLQILDRYLSSLQLYSPRHYVKTLPILQDGIAMWAVETMPEIFAHDAVKKADCLECRCESDTDIEKIRLQLFKEIETKFGRSWEESPV
jgi:hypothetical protein